MKKKVLCIAVVVLLILVSITSSFADTTSYPWHTSNYIVGTVGPQRSYSANTLYNQYTFMHNSLPSGRTWVGAVDVVTKCTQTNTYTLQFYVGGNYVTPVLTKDRTVSDSTMVYGTGITTNSFGMTVYNYLQDGVHNMPIKGYYTPYYVENGIWV